MKILRYWLKSRLWLFVLAVLLLSAGVGFALECYDCHGTRISPSSGDYRPLDASSRDTSTGGFPGNHRSHLSPPSSPSECEKCHPGSAAYTAGHRDGVISLAFSINSSPAIGSYRGGAVQFTQSSVRSRGYEFGTCSNVNCHFETTSPAWGGAPLGAPSSETCMTCHGFPPAGGGGGTAGSHEKHESYFAGGCGKCHSDHAAAESPFAHATSAGSRGIQVRPRSPEGIPEGSYSGSGDNYLPSQSESRAFGNCSDIYCHSSGAPFDKENKYRTVLWGSGELGCNGCHGNSDSTDELSGRHGKHAGGATYAFSCDRCHNETASGSSAINDRTLHVNEAKDVALKGGGNYGQDRTCTNLYCHSDAMNRPPAVEVKWSDTTPLQCDGCHRGTSANFRPMTSNGHSRLVGSQWIRKYPCTYCHAGTVASIPVSGKPPVDGGIVPGRHVNGSYSSSRHVNGARDVLINDFWKITGDRKSYAPPTYNTSTKVCDNVYCHSDGTTDPEPTRDFPWNWRKADGSRIATECNSCHGHARGSCADCHDGRRKFILDNRSTVLSVQVDWEKGEEWKSAMPMFANEGTGRPRANSHSRHLATDFSCDECHRTTIAYGGDCKACHQALSGSMGEVSHLNPLFHVNKLRDVTFKQSGPAGKNGTYNQGNKTCSGTACHTGADPAWGASVKSEVICLSCHGTYTARDFDDFGNVNKLKAQINLSEWKRTGHGRTMSNYSSGNPPANFPLNPCWYCHDNRILHNDGGNPFRLRLHNQFSNRFDKECVFCHMTGNDGECMGCHNNAGSLAPQLLNITTASHPHTSYTNGATSCVLVCHGTDATQHKTNAGTWTAEQKEDVKNQYMMMGVCLQCHDDDSNDKCNGCHDGSNPKYRLGFDPGTGYRKPVKAKASSVHFGYKHYKGFLASGGWEKDANGKVRGIWKGGKFCWDCHDPHGDTNLYMIQDYVATETDGRHGIPSPGKRKKVVFVQKNTGADYAKSNGTIDGICNVCHQTGSQHYRQDGGDGHNSSYVCTRCHEHKFTDSHGGRGSTCGTCHKSKPVPRHSGFGLPRDCTKCHAGDLNARVDVMGQFRGKSHHVQGIPANNKHCYECHWEATELGLIDIQYHEGYNYKNYTTVRDAKVDLVIYGPKVRPQSYRLYSSSEGRASAVQFTASKVSSPDIYVERKEVAKITNTCLGCHSDENNDTTPFDDCKTPRQYAWDRQSIAARYAQKQVTRWGKYSSTSVNAKFKLTKAFSAHGNAAANQGGWNSSTGTDSGLSDTRKGFPGMSSARQGVQCFDCHNSHGNTKAIGVTSSYVSYSGLRNGGNLKEVTAGKGGYKVTYFAKGKAAGDGVVNPYTTAAGQCFDCHMTEKKGDDNSTGTPWGYNSTFGATQPIKGYRDGYRFGDRNSDPYKLGMPLKTAKPIMGGHFKATNGGLKKPVMGAIEGLCTPCHDPHGVSPTLEGLQSYAVPLLKDTWLSSPYKEDYPAPNPRGTNSIAEKSWGTPKYQGRKYPNPDPEVKYSLDRNTFGTTAGTPKKMVEDDQAFAGLCLRCHPRTALLGNYTGAAGTATGANKAEWKSVERVHAAVKGWGTNKEHANPCSKCHQPHNSSLPRLMQTNCLDYRHRGDKASDGIAWSSLKALSSNGWLYYRDINDSSSRTQLRGYPIGSVLGKQSTSPEASISCHVSRFNLPFSIGAPDSDGVPASPVPTQWPNENYWNNVTPWPTPPPQ
ncbi:CxxxxCH/CxxCH domain-containing protein [Geobacter sp. DSM 9736]|uniref:CxxxxCH/CxxCH domain c-type cytochrome n=1 Tax=Geobacter sp. DSM 9736 TaxID=1277350 RepID=UPI000B505078|nr:CxxxxCH/CxxCH domain-containing protein [Geobacter sp. DSM 9736]SNB46002.1 Geobacter sulfurreducens CxxxxCH...CXXCH domain-containing protein [Geobacter sp. DSM 9736]